MRFAHCKFFIYAQVLMCKCKLMSLLGVFQQAGVFMRNQIVHGRTTTITYQTLEEILLAIHDVLWILDYCSGFDWALEHVRPDIRKFLEE